jgi:hypothetical protein
MTMGSGKNRALVTIEPCLDKARLLAERMVAPHLSGARHRRLVPVFTALAGGDVSIGRLAYCIWRRRVRRRM